MTTISCPQCRRIGKSSKPVPEGAKVRCPGCGASFRHGGEPRPGLPALAEPIEGGEAAATGPRPALLAAFAKMVKPLYLRVEAPPAPCVAPDRVACRFCGEDVLAVAKKCKHCGEFLDESLRKKPEPVLRPASRPAGVVVSNHVVIGERGPARWSRGMAMLLSLLLPGLGQAYKGHLLGGVAWLVLTAVGYCAFVVPGLVLHVLCVFGASLGDPRR